MFWPRLRDNLRDIATTQSEVPGPTRSPHELLEEILGLVRAQQRVGASKLDITEIQNNILSTLVSLDIRSRGRGLGAIGLGALGSPRDISSLQALFGHSSSTETARNDEVPVEGLEQPPTVIGPKASQGRRAPLVPPRKKT
jgi:hypothetical protein